MPETVSRSSIPTLSEAALHFLRQPRHFATIATLDADGTPHQAVAWYRLEGDTIVINSATGRRWPTNLLRDPRLSIAIEDGYDWLGVVGTADPVEDQAAAQADIAAMAEAYEEPAVAATSIARFQGQRRISFHVRPIRIHEEFEG